MDILLKVGLIILGIIWFIGMTKNISNVIKKQQALSKLRQKLAQEKIDRELIESLSNKPENTENLDAARALIQKCLQELEPSERKQILPGLNQPSTISQRSYIVSLLEKAAQ